MQFYRHGVKPQANFVRLVKVLQRFKPVTLCSLYAERCQSIFCVSGKLSDSGKTLRGCYDGFGGGAEDPR